MLFFYIYAFVVGVGKHESQHRGFIILVLHSPRTNPIKEISLIKNSKSVLDFLTVYNLYISD